MQFGFFNGPLCEIAGLFVDIGLAGEYAIGDDQHDGEYGASGEALAEQMAEHLFFEHNAYHGAAPVSSSFQAGSVVSEAVAGLSRGLQE